MHYLHSHLFKKISNNNIGIHFVYLKLIDETQVTYTTDKYK